MDLRKSSSFLEYGSDAPERAPSFERDESFGVSRCPYAGGHGPARSVETTGGPAVLQHARRTKSSRIDLFSAGTYLQGLPHAYFEMLRREAPVSWHEEPNGPGFWAVMRYRDVVTVARDAATFSSSRSPRIEDYSPDDPRVSPDVLLNMDPPRHGRYRGIVNKGFSPRLILALEPHIRELVIGMIDAVAGRGECDFVEALAGNLPLHVLLELLGIPGEDRNRVLWWSLRLLQLQDPEYATSPEEGVKLMETVMGYTQQLVARRREKPGEDVLTLLMEAEVDGSRLTDTELGLLFTLLLGAGHETTRSLIANGMLDLIQHPEQRQRLIDDPSLIPTAVEEMLRFTPPVIQFRRTAMRDTELGGQRISRGDKVVIFYASANRDEELFPDPHLFDVGRKPNNHLSFGHGPHFCIGTTLARLQARIAFEELLRRLPDMELAGPPVRISSNCLHGLKQMPVRFTPRRA